MPWEWFILKAMSVVALSPRGNNHRPDMQNSCRTQTRYWLPLTYKGCQSSDQGTVWLRELAQL